MSNLPKNRPVLRLKNRGGAPKDNRNAFKTGRHTAQVRALRKMACLIAHQARQALVPAPDRIAPREI